jgi:hypothetical protein
MHICKGNSDNKEYLYNEDTYNILVIVKDIEMKIELCVKYMVRKIGE